MVKMKDDTNFIFTFDEEDMLVLKQIVYFL